MSTTSNRQVRYASAATPYSNAQRMRQPRRFIVGDTTEEDDQSTTSQHNQPTTLERDNFDRIASIAREAYDATRVIMGELNVEQKLYVPLSGFSATFVHTVYDWANAFVLTTPSVANGWLNAVPQAITEAGRTGDSIKMTNLTMDWRLLATTALSGNAASTVTLLIYYCPGNTVISSNFSASATSTVSLLDWVNASTPIAPYAPKDYDGDSKKRVVIVGRHTMTVHANSPSQHHHFHIKLQKKTQFENDSSAINTGYLGYTIISDTNLQSLTTSYIASRLYFVDN